MAYPKNLRRKNFCTKDLRPLLEILEARINLSTMPLSTFGDAVPAGPHAIGYDWDRDRSDDAAILAELANANQASASQVSDPATPNAPTSSPTDPANPVNAPDPQTSAPPVAPTAPPSSDTDPVTVATHNLSGFNELCITGNSGNDSILVTQSGATFTIWGNGQSQTMSGSFNEVIVQGGAGSDQIGIASSVTIASAIYGGTGNNVLNDFGQGKATIVSIGGTQSVLTGNGANTSYWANSTDTINASTAEIAAGGVHRIAGFYQPWSTNSSSPLYISTNLNGPSLPNPTDSGVSKTLSSNSLWGNRPLVADVHQGQLSDCYFLSTLDALAGTQPNQLQNMAVDLGDGTYAVQFFKQGQPEYVRVNASFALSSNGNLQDARPGADGDLWVSIMEKAYAYFRSGKNTYASLNWGWTGDAFTALGIQNQNLGLSGNLNALYNEIAADAAQDLPMTVCTTTKPVNGLVVSHCYAVVGVTRNAAGQMTVTLHNPWGIDGPGAPADGNSTDGYITIPLAELQTNFAGGSVAVG